MRLRRARVPDGTYPADHYRVTLTTRGRVAPLQPGYLPKVSGHLCFQNKDELLKAGRERKIEEGKATGRGNKKVLSDTDNTFSKSKHSTRDTIAAAVDVSKGTE